MSQTKSSPANSAEFFKTFGRKIQAFRKAKKLTQAEAAKLCGVGTRFFSELENGKSTVEMGKVIQVLQALDLGFSLSDSPKREQHDREFFQNEAISRLSNHAYVKEGNTQLAIPMICEVMAEILQTEYNGIWFFNQAKDLLLAQDEYTLSEKKHNPVDNYSYEEFPEFFQALLKSRTLVEENTTFSNVKSGEFTQEANHYDITSTLDSPISLDGQVVGLISCEHYQVEHSWTSDEITFHGQLAGLMTEVLRNERYRQLLQDLEQQGKRDKNQQALIMGLVAHDSYRLGRKDEALNYTLEKIAQVYEVDRVSCWLKNNDNWSMYSCYEVSAKGYYLIDGSAVIDSHQLQYLDELQKALYINDDVATDGFGTVFQGVYKINEILHSVLESGVYTAGELVAVITLEREGDACEWLPHEESLINEISKQVAQLLINSELKESESKANEQIVYAAKLQKILSDLSTDIQVVNPDSFEKVIQYINEIMAKAIMVEGCGVWLTEEDGNTLRNIDYYELSADYHYVDAAYHRDEYPEFFTALERERTVAADDAQHDNRTMEFLDGEQKELGIGSSIDTVIRLNGRTVGVLNVEHYGDVRQWTADEIAFHGSVADIIGFILVNIDYKKQEQEKNKRLEIENNRIIRIQRQNEILTQVVTSEPFSNGLVDEVLTAICEKTQQILYCQRVEVWWFKAQSKVIEIAHGFDADRSHYKEDEPYDLAGSPEYLASLMAGRHVVYDSQEGGEDRAYFFELVRDKSITAGIDVAIRIGGVMVGLLAIEHCHGERYWAEDEVAFVASLSDQVAQALLNRDKVAYDYSIKKRKEQLQENQRILVELATHEDVINGDLANVASLVARLASVSLEVYNTSIWMFIVQDKRVELLSSYMLDGDYYEGDLQQYEHDADFDNEYYSELKKQRTIAVEDAMHDPLVADFVERFYLPGQISSTLESAIRVKGEVLGTVNLDHKGVKRQWANEDIAFCGGLADIIALTIMNAERIKSEQRYKALAEKREEMDAIINGSKFIVAEWGVGDHCPVEFISDNVSQFGYEPEDFYKDNKFFSRLIFVDDYKSYVSKINEIEKEGGESEYTLEYRIITKAGGWRWVEEHSKIHRNQENVITHYHGVISDITQRKENAHQLLMLSSAIEHSASGVFITNYKRGIEYINSSFSKITGYENKDLLSKDIASLKVTELSLDSFQSMLMAVDEARNWHGELQLVGRAGGNIWVLLSLSPIHNDFGELTHVVAVCEDIGEHKSHQKQMEQLAFYDTLTGLENRFLFRENLTKLVKCSKQYNDHHALLFLDLDRFKIINDTLGHDAGDQLLITVAQRLKASVKKDDVVARLGGDEFTIILKNIGEMDEAYVAAIAARIIGELSKPIRLGSEEVVVTVSIGITITPSDSVYISELMKYADLAMYKAKSLGRNNFQFYSSDLNTAASDELYLENELRQAIKRDEFVLYYQPILDHQGNTVSLESLLRWNHPQKGLLLPNDFISGAEKFGILIEIEKLVLEKAAKFIMQLQKTYPHRRIPVCVNVSQVMLLDKKFISLIKKLIKQYQIISGALHIEIEESIIISRSDKLLAIFNELKKLGLCLSVDDFGSAYSALNYLRDLPVDSIKIDQHFIQGTDTNSQDQQIVPAIIALAHRLNIQVVAEGVETATQLQFLSDNSCDYHQGYLFEQAMTEQAVLKKLI